MASQDWFDKDFYATLGVAKDVSETDLKKTYRKLARKYHPDSNPGDAAAEAKFKEISEAYSVLSDSEQRAEYDQIRAMGAGGARFSAGGAGGGGGFDDVFSAFNRGRGGQSADFDDIFAMFNQGGGSFGGGGGFGSGRFGQSSGGFRGFGGPQKGADVTARTTLSFDTAVRGETVTLQGEDGHPMKVRIPAGAKDGQSIRLRGRGRPGHGPPASGVHPRRAEPACRGAGDVHRGGVGGDHRGADAGRGAREAQGSPRHALGAGAAGQGSRCHDEEGDR